MKKYALITGATSGIGLEFAHVFAKKGHSLVLVGRNLEKLTQLVKELAQYRVQLDTVCQDLSQPDSAQKVFQELQKKHVDIEILVNNAGFGDYGEFGNSDVRKQQEMIQLNCSTLMSLTHFFLPQIKKHKGKILNVASTASFMPGPLMPVYFATKAFVLSFSESLACQLAPSGVTVTTLCPGPTQSSFSDSANMSGFTLFSGSSVPTSAQVAEYGYHHLMKGSGVVVHGWRNSLMVWAARFMPRALLARVVMMVQERR